MIAKHKSKIFYSIWAAVILLLLFNPNFKAWINQQFMKIGFHKPNLEKPLENATSTEKEALSITTEGSSATFGRPSIWFTDGLGVQTDAANLKGKVVFINFWATWCSPCIAELPSIQKLYTKFKDREDMVFLLVDVDGKLVESADFMKNKKLDLPVHIALDAIPSDWLGNSIPTTMVLTKNGQIAMRHEGMADYSSPEVFEFIQKLLDESTEN